MDTDTIAQYMAWLRERRDRAEHERSKCWDTMDKQGAIAWVATREAYQQAIDMYLELRDKASAGQGDG